MALDKKGKLRPFGDTRVTDGTLVATVRDTGASDSLNVAIVDAAGNQITSFGGTAASELVDDATFTPAVSSVTMGGFFFDDVAPDSVNEGDGGAGRMSANRSQYIQIRDGSSNERGANVTASNELSVLSSAQPGVDIGDVTVNNGAGAAAVNIQDGGNSITVDGTVTASNPSIQVDDAAFTPAVSSVTMIGAEFDDVAPDSINEGDGGAVRMSANRNLYSSIRDAAGNERGANVSATNELQSVVSDVVGTPVTLAALNDTAQVALSGRQGCSVFFNNTDLAADIFSEYSFNNGVTWEANNIGFLTDIFNGYVFATTFLSGVPAAFGYSIIFPSGVTHVRVRVSSVPTGTCVATLRATMNSYLDFWKGTSSLPTVITGTVLASGTVEVITRSLDDVAFNPATEYLFPPAYRFDDVATDSVDEGDKGIARMSGNRNQYIQIRDNAGNERGANVTASSELNVIATAQPGVDIGDVTINNAGAAAAVNIQDGGNTITVDGTVVATPSGTQDTNVTQLAGTGVSVGNGVVGAGVQRVTVASDSTGQTIIRSGATTDQLTVDATSKAARVTPYDSLGNNRGTKASYRATTTANLVVPTGANATNAFFTLFGSGTKTIIVQRMFVSGLTLAAVAYNSMEVVKYSAAGSGGTSTTPTFVPLDSTSAAATVTNVKFFTVINSTPDTAIGRIACRRNIMHATTAAAAGIPAFYDFDFRTSGSENTGVYLRGTGQGIGLSMGAAPATAVTLAIEVEWTEES